VGAIDPANLGTAQTARTNTILCNVRGPAAGITIASDVPPALAASRASQMKNATDFVNNQGAATGKLGGYGDQWFNSNLEEQNAARKVGIGNLFANEEKSLISPRQDLAAAAAYKTPSWIPGVMQGVGSMLGSYSGRGGNRKASGGAQPQYYPSGSGGDSLDWG
jgi:hypothetical protein